ncbi:UDP-glucose 4-epimerase GalE [Falsibacillus pallidus]|uniref:UDP-glucose 4-epimerase n=1 Tax=Falsibacillus pallidus TaxID=493781 RepID=A0A370GQX0_9BACI|nr:UDP-glucose 4-epimerase GalE [Falsibacillus pallidus]RDI45710.1 UDP-galactose 4-epimerase [Falsibacillus pallidus]
MAILVTGGAGYIGSHTLVELLQAGYQAVVVDNFSNSSEESLKRVSEITGKKVEYYSGSLLDKELMERIFIENHIHAVIHFAGLKAVGESVEKPLHYYQNNIGGTLSLLETMLKFNVKSLVFSSSATVYGNPKTVPVIEESHLSTTNPYGRTKLFIEEILKDLSNADPNWSITTLRYFNPIGAHSSGEIGEDPKGIPNNLLPFITKVASGELEMLHVFGADYPTEDGTGVRDYIHVVDLAEGHVKALEKNIQHTGIHTYNLGTGNGYSVLQVIQSFEKTTGIKIPYKIEGRRPGDVPVCFADATKAEFEWGWKAGRRIDEMCKDAWNWQSKYPAGYKTNKIEEISSSPRLQNSEGLLME